jgi:hypothetical protein
LTAKQAGSIGGQMVKKAAVAGDATGPFPVNVYF